MVTQITQEKYLKLKEYHKKAKDNKSIVFCFEGRIFNVSFAENLLYYLKSIYEPIKRDEKKYVRSKRQSIKER